MSAATAPLLRVALTGGIATGKSYCLARFRALGATVIDADVLARQALAPGSPAFDAVVDRFGPASLRADGTIDRDRVGQAVFSDPNARRDLEAIVHPVVYEGIRRWFDDLPASTRVAIADIPLLYETGHDRDFDRVVVAACSFEQQLERLMERSGLSTVEAGRRIASQWPIGEKVRRADYVIDTSGAFEETDRQVDVVWRKLTTGPSSGPS